MSIHPSAIIEDGAQLGADVSIGPFCVVGPKVVLGDRVELKSHVVVTGDTTVGADTVIFPFCCIGEIPQDVKFKGEAAKLIIGERNRIREHVTMNPGTEGGGGVTKIGDDGFFLAGSHVAHDATVGDRVIIVNQSAVAGHCVIEDDVIIGGLCGIHQFVRIGEHSFCGVNTYCTLDVPPFMLVAGNKAITHGINIRGLRRRGVDKDTIVELKRAYKTIYRSGHTMAHALDELAGQDWQSAQVQQLIDFIRDSKRGVIR